MITDTETIQIEDWVLRVRVPDGPGPFPVILMLHGWTGDENAMWVFARALPESFLLIAPRAPHESTIGGYSWYPMTNGKTWPDLDDFRPAVGALLELIDNWPASAPPPADFSNLRLAGFSQGAALTYAFSLIHPERVTALAGLAGFLPEGSTSLFQGKHLEGKPVYISHGTNDELVSIEKARQAVRFFDQIGAEVTYCESDAGHKLNADCFKGMEVFFQY
jgi:phospholipase/carboxylesterase